MYCYLLEMLGIDGWYPIAGRIVIVEIKNLCEINDHLVFLIGNMLMCNKCINYCRRRFPVLNVLIQSAMSIACFGIALPIAIALFLQMTQVSYHVTASLAFYNVNYIIFFMCVQLLLLLIMFIWLLLNDSIVLLQQWHYIYSSIHSLFCCFINVLAW